MTSYVAWGFDYTNGPPIAVLKAAGATFVCRYIAWGPQALGQGKVIGKAELDALLAAGIDVVINWETDGSMNSEAQGAEAARLAQQMLDALGIPHAAVYFSADFNPNVGTAGILAYMRGVASVLGHDRTGLYAGFKGIKDYFDAGIGKYGWQTYAWSANQWDDRAQLEQYQNDIQVGPIKADQDRVRSYGSNTTDFGAVKASGPKPPVPPPPFNPHPVLRLGDSGPAVMLLQEQLNIHGAKLTVDGKFGPVTFAAVEAFQTRSKLVVDGIVGPLTWAALLLPPPAPEPKEDEPAAQEEPKDVEAPEPPKPPVPPPPPKPPVPPGNKLVATPFVMDGAISLRAFVVGEGHNTIGDVIELTFQHESLASDRFLQYVSAGDWNADIPGGIVVWYWRAEAMMPMEARAAVAVAPGFTPRESPPVPQAQPPVPAPALAELPPVRIEIPADTSRHLTPWQRFVALLKRL